MIQPNHGYLIFKLKNMEGKPREKNAPETNKTNNYFTL